MDREESALDVDLGDGSHIRIGNNTIQDEEDDRQSFDRSMSDDLIGPITDLKQPQGHFEKDHTY